MHHWLDNDSCLVVKIESSSTRCICIVGKNERIPSLKLVFRLYFFSICLLLPLLFMTGNHHSNTPCISKRPMPDLTMYKIEYE